MSFEATENDYDYHHSRAYVLGALDERSRIRQEILEELDRLSSWKRVPLINAADMRAAIDRICPNLS